MGRQHALRCAVLLISLFAFPAAGQIYRWDNGELIPGTEVITPGPEFELTDWNTSTQNLEFADFSGELDLSHARLYRNWLSYARFTYANLSDALLANSQLIETDFQNANLTQSSFYNSNLSGAHFHGADLSGAYLKYVNATGAVFRDADLINTSCEQAIFMNADLTGADLTNADLQSAWLGEANLHDAIIAGADLSGTTSRGFSAEQLMSTIKHQHGDLRGTQFDYNIMPGWDFSSRDLTGARFEYALLDDSDFSSATLDQAYMRNASLAGVNFSNASLKHASLGNADLFDADLRNANLTDVEGKDGVYVIADLRGANLHNAYFAFASFDGADLRNAYLAGTGFDYVSLAYADLRHTNLNNADLYNCDLLNSDFSYADMRGAKYEPAYVTDGQVVEPIMDHLIDPNGFVADFGLSAGQSRRLYDYEDNIPVTVTERFEFNPQSTLELLLSDYVWGSSIVLSDGALVELDGQLCLAFEDAYRADLHRFVGMTYDLFDWNDSLDPGATFAKFVTPTGYVWDLSDLYVGGTVTLLDVPPIGNCDADGDVDAQDMQTLWECLLGPELGVDAGCACLNVQGDADIDVADLSFLQQFITGPRLLGDDDADGEYEISDIRQWLRCIIGPGIVVDGKCIFSDVDYDTDVDLEDLAFLQIAYGQSQL